MNKNRLEAFSDGVIAIIITIMVLDIKATERTDWEVLRDRAPIFLSYVFSFVFVGIYWSNHHHLLQAIQHVNGVTLWANLHLLFWLSLTPVVTYWMGETHFAEAPVVLYGIILLMSAIAFRILARTLVAHHGKNSALARALGNDFKGMVSIGVYASAIPLAFVHPWIAVALYAGVTIMWFIPDRRIEKVLHDAKPDERIAD